MNDASIPENGAKNNLTRRQALGLGLLGLAGAGVAGLTAYRFIRSGGAAAGSTAVSGPVSQAGKPMLPGTSVFRLDAPTGELWEQWKKRGWAHEAYHYSALGRNMQCAICPNRCLLEPGDRSHCRNRVNKDGKLYTLAYGNPCALHVDPIEKKPLFHFMPNTPAFSLATAGCTLRCLNCQNWEISQSLPEKTKDASGDEVRVRPQDLSYADTRRLSLFPEDAVAAAAYFKCASIAYTYSEPIAYYEYLYDTAKLARANKIKNAWITCGYINEEALKDLCQYIDAACVNLKSFDEDIYQTLNAGKLQPILDTLKVLKREGVWFEVVNLVVPSYTDKPEMIKRMCGWLADNLGPDYPLHFSRFNHAYKLDHLPPTPLDILLEARAIAMKAGLRYVYIGNVYGEEDVENTFCPGCKKALIERETFAVLANHIKDGKCGYCGTLIAGVWS